MRYYLVATLALAFGCSAFADKPPARHADLNSFYADAFKEWLKRLMNPRYAKFGNAQEQEIDQSKLQNGNDRTFMDDADLGQSDMMDAGQQDSSSHSSQEQEQSSELSETDQDNGDQSSDESDNASADEAGDNSDDDADEDSGDQDGDSGDKPSDKLGDKPGESPGEGEQPGQQPGLTPGSTDSDIINYILNRLLGARDVTARSDGKSITGKERGGQTANSGERFRIDADVVAKDEDFKAHDDVKIDPNNPIVDILVRQVIRSKVDLSASGDQIKKSFASIDNMVEFITEPITLAAYSKIRSVYHDDISSISDWYRRIHALSHQDLGKARIELEKFRGLLRAYRNFFNHYTVDEMITQVESILHDIETAHTVDQKPVKDLFESLPPMGRSYLRRMYNLEDGSGYNLLASHLAHGQIWYLALTASLVADAKFKIRHFDDAQSFKATKTFIADDSKQKGRDILPFRHFGELARTVRGQPGKELEDNIIEGTAIVKKTKALSEVASREGRKRDPITLSVLALDISGSMQGGVGLYQGAFATAFVLNALSEKGKSGKTSHHVVILPFDDRVHEPIWITKPKDVFHLIEEYPTLLKNRESQTDVSKVLLEAINLINSRARSGSISLKHANIVLLTDGMSEVEVALIKSKREAIKHPVQLFVANWRKENPKLKELNPDSLVTFSIENIKARLSSNQPRTMSAHAVGSLHEIARQKLDDGLLAVDNLVAEYKSIQSECDASEFSDFVSHLQDRVTAKDDSYFGALVTQTNAFLRKQHLFFQGERALLDCFLIDIMRYVKNELQLNRLKPTQNDIQALHQMFRLTRVLANAERSPSANGKTQTPASEIPSTWSFTVFSLFPGDFRQTCDKCVISDAGAIKCNCQKGGSVTEASLEHAADCFTSIENSAGTLGCMPGGSYLQNCRYCWFDSSNRLVCQCDGQSKYMHEGRSCLYADYRDGALVCIKRRPK